MPSDPVRPAQFRPVEVRDGLDPAEALLDALADPLARGIAGVAGRPRCVPKTLFELMT